MLLKLEDYIYAGGASYEYINSEKIIRIRMRKKRIYIWIIGKTFAFYVGRTKHNMEELKKIRDDIEW